MAFIANGRQLHDGAQRVLTAMTERKSEHFRDELWSLNDLGELTAWSGGSRMFFSRSKEQDKLSTRSYSCWNRESRTG